MLMLRGDLGESASTGMAKDQFLIYGLIDPRTDMVRYVGRSCSGMSRPRQHQRPVLESDRTHRANWIRSLHAEGLRHRECVLEVVTKETIADSEVWWIAYGRALGWPLTNISAGGGLLGYTHKQESKALLSEWRTKFYRDNDEARAAVGERTRAWYRDHPEEAAEQQAAQSRALKAFYESQEARDSVGRRARAYFERHPEARRARGEELRAWHRANPEASAATYEKMSAARGTPEARALASVRRKAAHAANPNEAIEHGARMKAMYAANPELRERQAAKSRETSAAVWRDPVRREARMAKMRATCAAKKTHHALALARLGEEE